MLKRLALAAVVIGALFSLAGCQGEEKSEQTTPTESAAPAETATDSMTATDSTMATDSTLATDSATTGTATP